MSKIRRRILPVGSFVVAVVAATSVAASAITSEPSASGAERLTIEAPALDDELGSKPLTERAGSEVDVDTAAPLVIASSVSGRIDGGETPYTLDVLDSRSSIEEIVKLDSLEPLTDTAHWAVFRNSRGSATEIVGEADGVLISLIIGDELSAEEASALIAGLHVEESK